MRTNARTWVGLAIVALLLVLGWLLVRRALGPDAEELSAAEERAVGYLAPPGEDEEVAGDPALTEEDLAVLRRTLDWAAEERLDTLPLGDIVARIGRTFVGTDYVPHTLDPPGPERLVVNLRELDCVTFLENALVLGRMVRDGERSVDAYLEGLEQVRYRGGELDGYPSRLHYFSEWIADNERKGVVRNITREIGGVPDDEPIDFMSTHADAYPKLADPRVLEQIRETERELSARTRYYVPQDRIAQAAPEIRDGDIIAATSTVEGLDVAHTGLALWIEGRLHLLHAPLVGSSVEISRLPLAERIRGIDGQDGIMVARPL